MQLAQGPGKTVVVQPKSGKPLAHLDAAYPFDGLVIAAPQETGHPFDEKERQCKSPRQPIGSTPRGKNIDKNYRIGRTVWHDIETGTACKISCFW